MSITLLPHEGQIQVTDLVRFSEPVKRFEFVLNAGLTTNVDHGQLETLAVSDDELRVAYRVSLQTPQTGLKLHYHGRPRFSEHRSHGGMPQGQVSPEGVYLDRSSAWYPQLNRSVSAFRMTVTLPDGWQSVSAGRREVDTETVTWSSDRPHDDLHLIAGRFTRHSRPDGQRMLSVYLLEDDAALANRYLEAIGGYLDHYSGLIGDYPYAKFAVVENPWQTGYGMPSFTLLGSRVLRLPFILHTSLPHEILHNWWGNGVWVDYDRGNWSEGLTAYLADHWMQERAGKGDQYRLKALQRYSNFAASGPDAPLDTFVNRHNEATQSIGYSKSLMLFHMIRTTLGDEKFKAGLRRLWERHAFQRIGFEQAIRTLIDDDLALYRQLIPWLTQSGAPRIRLHSVSVERDGDAWLLRLVIDQQQPTLFTFDLPLAVTVQDDPQARRLVARMNKDSHHLEYRFERRPVRIDIDPEYDVLRIIDPSEQPPALNRLFGSARTWLVMPSSAPAQMRKAWNALAEVWSKRYPGIEIIDDDEARRLKPSDDRLLLGWRNSELARSLPNFARDGQILAAHGLQLGDEFHDAGQTSIVLVSNDPDGVTTGFVGAPSAQAVEALARKLPHYGSYGRLIFDRDGRNMRKDTLSSSHSTLTRQLADEQFGLRLPPRPVLGTDDQLKAPFGT